MPAPRQPAIFVPHGGGPCFWIEFPPPFGPHAWDRLRDYLSGLVASLPERPKAFLVVTAHWEAAEPTVSVNPKPGMLYDYYGFPEHTYKLSYPAPGASGAGGRSQAAHRGGRPAGRDRRRAAASTTACSCPSSSSIRRLKSRSSCCRCVAISTRRSTSNSAKRWCRYATRGPRSSAAA